MLRQRVVTAVVLAAAFLGLLFFSPWFVFAAVIGLVLCVAAWEWADLSGWRAPWMRVLYVLITAALGAAAAWWLVITAGLDLTRSFLVAACCWWALALLWVQGYPSSAVLWGSRPARSLMGWLVLIPAWCGLIILRSEPAGPLLILFVVLLIACADIGAYFSGRNFGRRKLARQVSPGKSWEGVLGGLIAALIVASVWNVFAQAVTWPVLVAVVVPTVLVSVLGDLLESMVKRHRGVKDSSHILPGHGGLLDRIDGLTAAVPVFALAMLLSGFRL